MRRRSRGGGERDAMRCDHNRRGRRSSRGQSGGRGARERLKRGAEPRARDCWGEPHAGTHARIVAYRPMTASWRLRSPSPLFLQFYRFSPRRSKWYWTVSFFHPFLFSCHVRIR
jgi:hypothetical protein